MVGIAVRHILLRGHERLLERPRPIGRRPRDRQGRIIPGILLEIIVETEIPLSVPDVDELLLRMRGSQDRLAILIQHGGDGHLLFLPRAVPAIDAIGADRRRGDAVLGAELEAALERRLHRGILGEKSRRAARKDRQRVPHGHRHRIRRDRDIPAADHALAARRPRHPARRIELIVGILQRIGIRHGMRAQIVPVASDGDAVPAGIRIAVIRAPQYCLRQIAFLRRARREEEIDEFLPLGEIARLEIPDGMLCRAAGRAIVEARRRLRRISGERDRARRDERRVRHEARRADASRGDLLRHIERLRRRILRDGELIVRVVPGELVRHGAVLRLPALDDVRVLLVVLRRTAELDIDRIADIVDRLEVAVRELDVRLAVPREILDIQRVVVGLRDVCVPQADMQRRGRDRALADERIAVRAVRGLGLDLIVRIIDAEAPVADLLRDGRAVRSALDMRTGVFSCDIPCVEMHLPLIRLDDARIALLIRECERPQRLLDIVVAVIRLGIFLIICEIDVDDALEDIAEAIITGLCLRRIILVHGIVVLERVREAHGVAHLLRPRPRRVVVSRARGRAGVGMPLRVDVVRLDEVAERRAILLEHGLDLRGALAVRAVCEHEERTVRRRLAIVDLVVMARGHSPVEHALLDGDDRRFPAVADRDAARDIRDLAVFQREIALILGEILCDAVVKAEIVRDIRAVLDAVDMIRHGIRVPDVSAVVLRAVEIVVERQRLRQRDVPAVSACSPCDIERQILLRVLDVDGPRAVVLLLDIAAPALLDIARREREPLDLALLFRLIEIDRIGNRVVGRLDGSRLPSRIFERLLEMLIGDGLIRLIALDVRVRREVLPIVDTVLCHHEGLAVHRTGRERLAGRKASISDARNGDKLGIEHLGLRRPIIDLLRVARGDGELPGLDEALARSCERRARECLAVRRDECELVVRSARSLELRRIDDMLRCRIAVRVPDDILRVVDARDLAERLILVIEALERDAVRHICAIRQGRRAVIRLLDDVLDV